MLILPGQAHTWLYCHFAFQIEMGIFTKKTFQCQRIFVQMLCVVGICTVWFVLKVTTFSSSDEENQTFFTATQNNCGCVRCLKREHPWFNQHFQRTISPFLTSYYSLPLEAFEWWRGIQLEQRSFLYFMKIKERIFELFPAVPPVAGPSPDRCRRCAVVGNSGNLLRSNYGKVIDSNEIVFRINFGQTKGFEKDVGSKTTHRAMYPESATNLDNSTHLVMFAFKIKDLEWLLDVSTEPYVGIPLKTTISANKNLVMVVNPAFMKYVHHSWLQQRGRYPSTGFMTVILALHMCDEVSVFGFGADSDGNWSHYFEVLKVQNYRTGPHPGYFEYNIIVELAKRGKVTLYRGQ